MKFPRNLKPFTGQLDAAPLAAVLFLLVLFLLLHSYLAPPPGIRIQLPALPGAGMPGLANPAVVVALDRSGQLYYEHQAIKENDLRERLALKARQSREPLTLLIQADEAVRQAAILRLAGMAREAGLRDFWIQTRPPLFPGAPAPAPAR